MLATAEDGVICSILAREDAPPRILMLGSVLIGRNAVTGDKRPTSPFERVG